MERTFMVCFIAGIGLYTVNLKGLCCITHVFGSHFMTSKFLSDIQCRVKVLLKKKPNDLNTVASLGEIGKRCITFTYQF